MIPVPPGISMAPYKMVDMKGIDLSITSGVRVQGIFDELVQDTEQELIVIFYHWEFAGITLPPSYCVITRTGDKFTLNGKISINVADIVALEGSEAVLVTLYANNNGTFTPPVGADGFSSAIVTVSPNLTTLQAIENGTYVPPSGYDGFSEVEVNVSGGVLVPLSVSANGVYLPQTGEDGFSSVEVAVPAGVLQPLSLTENGTYLPPAGYDGFSSVVANVTPFSSDLTYFLDNYGGGSEYSGYIYGTTVISNCHMVLLSDMSQNTSATTGTLSQSFRIFSALVLQGIYNKQRQSAYNTTMCYLSPKTSKAYWAGMKDRNNSYTCYVTLTGDTTFSLSGNKQVLIYGIP